MSQVNVTIEEAAVTAVHEFNSFKGYGVDFFIEAQSSNGTVYLQVVVYDEEARNDCRVIHEGDTVKVTGVLSVKPYQKKDGTVGTAVTIERPTLFVKIASNNCHPQLLQQTEETINNESSDDKNAVTASDEAYYSSYKDYSDIENPWEYEPEELEKIFKHIEEYKKRTRTSSPAGTLFKFSNDTFSNSRINVQHVISLLSECLFLPDVRAFFD